MGGPFAGRPWATTSLVTGSLALAVGSIAFALFAGSSGSGLRVTLTIVASAFALLLAFASIVAGIVGLVRNEGARSLLGVLAGALALLPTGAFILLALIAFVFSDSIR